MLQRVFQIVAGVDARNGLARRPELTNRKRNPRGKAGLARCARYCAAPMHKTTDLGEALTSNDSINFY